MIRLKFAFFGETQIDRTIARLERVDDMRPAWALLKERFLAWEARWFASEGSGTWSPLSPPYAKWKAQHYPVQTILRRDDVLHRSLTVGPDIDIEEPSFAIFGSADPVARYHQEGAGRLPVRKVISLDENERQEWVKTVSRWLQEEAE